MRKTLIALAAGLMTLSALPAAAADLPGQNRPNAERPNNDRQDGRGESSRDNDRQDGRGESSRDNDRNDSRGNRNDDRYGRWDARWGARPSAPPRHFTRTSDWYRHVRACQQRYRSYNARTDRYVPRRGQTAVCRL